MLLLSSGDNGASLPINSLQQYQPDVMPECQSSMECDSAVTTGFPSTPASKAVERDRDEALGLNQTAFAPINSGDRIMLRATVSAPSSHRRSALLRDPYLPEIELDGLYALRQASKLKTQRPADTRPHKLVSATLTDNATATSDDAALGSYAAPLAPLRERDIVALSALFQRDDMYAIEADVKHRLLALLPEPCWDEEVFAFLHEFL